MIRVVFQNENFVVCHKPAMCLSVPAREKTDARPCLGLELQKQFKKQVFPVHRLDYEVSGLILYALNSRAHKTAQDWFVKKTIRKLYRAETMEQNFSHWPTNVSTDRAYINSEAGQSFVWKTQMLRGKRRSFESKNGEWAETEAEIKKNENGIIFWQLYPVTGKPHQLRFELSRRGFPILGDSLYGSSVSRSQQGIALEAFELDLSRISERLGLPEKIRI